MDFSQALNARRSIRRFKQIPVEDSLLRSLIDAAAKAPSASNNQVLRYKVIRKAPLLEQVFSLTLWGGAVRPKRDPQFGVNSPAAFIAVCAPDPGNGSVSKHVIGDAGAAIQNILLQAVDSGLGTCWIGAFDPAKVNQLLGLKDLTCIYLVAVGYPAESPVMLRIHKGDSTKYFLDSEDVLHVPKYQPEDIAEFL